MAGRRHKREKINYRFKIVRGDLNAFLFNLEAECELEGKDLQRI